MKSSIAFAAVILSLMLPGLSAAPAISVTYGIVPVVPGRFLSRLQTRFPPWVSITGRGRAFDTGLYSLVMFDTDASKFPDITTKYTYLHWWVVNIPATAINTLTSFNAAPYVPPNPHDADVHRYEFQLRRQSSRIFGPFPIGDQRYISDFELEFVLRYGLGEPVSSTNFREVIFVNN